jgi:hypothetical protein
MATRAQVLIPITIAAFIVGIAGILSIPSDVKFESVEFPRGTIKIDNVVLEVQIADTDPLRTSGLMFQEELPFDQGMLLVFEGEERRSIWMLNMQFSLDMIWFDQDGKVVHIETDVPPCKTALEITTCQSIIPDDESVYVLEVTSGFVEENNITKDSILSIISI